MVSLKLSGRDAAGVASRFGLASPLTASETEPSSLWLGPGHWLIVSDRQAAGQLSAQWQNLADDVVCLALDVSAAFEVIAISGHGARDLLSAGSGVDFRAARFPPGSCCRTRLARIAVIVSATDADSFELYIDSSYSSYFDQWLASESAITAA